MGHHGSAIERKLVLVAFNLLLSGMACALAEVLAQPSQLIEPWVGEGPTIELPSPVSMPSDLVSTLLPPTRGPDEPYLTPTPDLIRDAPVIRTETLYHVVQYGESVGGIAIRYGVGTQQIITANNLFNPDFLVIGQVLMIPAPILQAPGPSFKIIPDSELIYGPGSIYFDVREEIGRWNGILASYVEEVENQLMDGATLVQLVSQRYSVNPRLLLALLEYQSGWLTRQDASPERRIYPMGNYFAGSEGLFSQLSWAADQLNTGYYLWRAGWEGPYLFSNGRVVIPGAGVNAGTVGVQYLFSQLYPVEAWRMVVEETGFYPTLLYLFGIPFDRSVEPLLPHGLGQPSLQLPFEQGKTWSFTGGPHSVWGNGAGWAALDFAPPGPAYGCVRSNEWVVAVADGQVLRSEEGEVIQELDNDGYEQTGWVVLYLHIDSRDRVQVETDLRAGDRIGHPSCEGGFSTATHLHIARKYNGEWIPADGTIPVILDGWISAGLDFAYDGTLRRDEVLIEACSCRDSSNQISR